MKEKLSTPTDMPTGVEVYELDRDLPRVNAHQGDRFIVRPGQSRVGVMHYITRDEFEYIKASGALTQISGSETATPHLRVLS